MIVRLAQRMLMIIVLAVVCAGSMPVMAVASVVPPTAAQSQTQSTDASQQASLGEQPTPGKASMDMVCSPGLWQTDYFDNATMQGKPRRQMCEAASTPKLHKNWLDQSPTLEPPDPTFPADRFSMRATCLCDFAAGSYLFSIAADDGAKLLIDDEVLIETTAAGAAAKTLSGTHTITIAYSERTGGARLVADWNLDTTAPKPVIASPQSGDRYASASTVSFSGSATDSSGAELPKNALAWSVQHKRCQPRTGCRMDTIATAAGTTGSFSMPQVDPAATEYIIVSLTATDPRTSQSATTTTALYFGTRECGRNTWKAQFFPTTDLSGVPSYERCWRFRPTAKLKQNWSNRAPIFRPANAAFPKDFSARFICNCSFSGATRFTVRADEHAIVSIDGVDRLDTRTTNTYNAHLTGTHRIAITFVDTAGPANLFVQW